jgi:hypothetical protein
LRRLLKRSAQCTQVAAEVSSAWTVSPLSGGVRAALTQAMAFGSRATHSRVSSCRNDQLPLRVVGPVKLARTESDASWVGTLISAVEARQPIGTGLTRRNRERCTSEFNGAITAHAVERDQPCRHRDDFGGRIDPLGERQQAVTPSLRTGATRMVATEAGTCRQSLATSTSSNGVARGDGSGSVVMMLLIRSRVGPRKLYGQQVDALT